MKINRLINPKVYVNPTQANISFDSSVPFWAKTYINDAYKSAYNKDSYYSNDVYLTYSGQKLFKVNGSNGNYSLAPITKDLNEAKKIIESIDNNEELSASFAPDYNSKNTTIYNIIYAYYKQGQDIFDDWSEYRINPNDLLWVEGSYSYANQLLSNVSKFNPSLSNRTDSSSFIKDNLTFQAVKAAFSPDPSERFVFYDLNGNKIEYNSSVYDSFELMKQNIIRNIEVKKSAEYIYINDNGIEKEVVNQNHSLYKLGVEKTHMYFADHNKTSEYIKTILNKYVTYL